MAEHDHQAEQIQTATKYNSTKREAVKTVTDLHSRERVKVKRGFEILTKDIKKWDQNLFDPCNFPLALIKKQQEETETKNIKDKYFTTRIAFNSLEQKELNY